MRLRMAEDARALFDAAGFGIGSAVIQALDAGGGDDGGAGGAGFQGDIEVEVGQSVGAERLAGGADGEDFGMGGWVEQFAGAVAGAGDDGVGSGVDEDGTDGDFAAFGGFAGLIEGAVHETGDGHVLDSLGLTAPVGVRPVA